MATCWPVAPVLAAEARPDAAIDCTALHKLLESNAAHVVDLSLSRDYLREHIPGAWFAIRTRLGHAFKTVPLRGTLVLTSEDGVLARLALAEAASLVEVPVRYLAGVRACRVMLRRGDRQTAGTTLAAAAARLPRLASDDDPIWRAVIVA